MQKLTLAIDGSSSSATSDASIYSRSSGFAVQFEGVAGGGTYKIEASLDAGTTWTDITKSFIDLSTGVLFAADIAANTIAVLQVAIPGLIRIRNTTAGSGTPSAIVGSFGPQV